MSAPLEKSRMMSTPLEMSTATSQGEERQPKRQHQEKSDGASTAAAAAVVSAPLEKSRMVTTPLEMSTVTSHGEERQLVTQHEEKRDGASTPAAAVARSGPLEMRSTLRNATKDDHRDGPRRGETAEETAPGEERWSLNGGGGGGGGERATGEE